MVANKYAFLQITRRRFLNEWEAFKKVISRRNIDRKSGSAGMPRPSSYAVFCLKKKKQVKLKAEPRTNVGRSGVNKLRARGIIPAVIYGGKVKPQPLQVTARDINAMMSHASGENVLVDLEIAGEKSNRAALVQEV